jgi:hypothetical protein
MPPPSSESKNKPSMKAGGKKSIVSQKIEPFIPTSVRTSNPTKF